MTKPKDITMRTRNITINDLYTHLMDYEIIDLEKPLDATEMSFYVDCILARVEVPKLYGYINQPQKKPYTYHIIPNKYLLSIIHYMHGDFVYNSNLDFIKSVSFITQENFIKRRIKETYLEICYFERNVDSEEFINNFINTYKTQNLI